MGKKDKTSKSSYNSSDIILEESFDSSSNLGSTLSSKMDALLARLSALEDKAGKDEEPEKEVKREVIYPGGADNLLPDVKFDKPRNQYEYDFLLEVLSIIEDNSGDIDESEKLELVKASIHARAAILITAQDEGWGVAGEMDLFQTPKKQFMKSYAKDVEEARKRYTSRVKPAAKNRYSKPVNPIIIQTSGGVGDNRSSGKSEPKRGESNRGACFVCGATDHFANRCPKRTKSGNGGFQPLANNS